MRRIRKFQLTVRSKKISFWLSAWRAAADGRRWNPVKCVYGDWKREVIGKQKQRKTARERTHEPLKNTARERTQAPLKAEATRPIEASSEKMEEREVVEEEEKEKQKAKHRKRRWWKKCKEIIISLFMMRRRKGEEEKERRKRASPKARAEGPQIKTEAVMRIQQEVRIKESSLGK